MGGDVADDCVLQVGDGGEGASPDSSPGDGGEEALDGVEPRGGSGGEVERPARMVGEPFEDIRLFVGGIVVGDGVDHLAGRDGALDSGEEADELLVAMALHAASDHGSVEHVEGGEQRRCAVAFVVVCHRPAFAGLERQAGLRAVEGLNLAFLVDRDDHGVLGRVHVEADDVLDLGREIGIVGALEGADAMRLQPMRLPQPLDRAQADADGVGHGAAGPMRGLARRLGAGQLQNPGDDLGRKRRAAGLAGLVAQQTIDALLGVARLPAPHRRAADPGSTRDFEHRQALGRAENDICPLHMFERTVAVGDDRQQALAIFGGRKDANGLGHAHRFAHPSALVNRAFVSVH